MKQLLQAILKYAKHPITLCALTICVALLLFWLSRSRADPVFVATNPELVAEQTDEAPKLTLYWEGKETKNVVSVKISLWNRGRLYIDSKAISSTDPIAIIPSEDIRILSSITVRTSRKSLRFKTPIIRASSTNQRDKILVEMEGDEALEKGDGATLRILYEGSEDCTFTVIGRIKGCPRGFRKLRYKKAKNSSSALYVIGTFASIIPVAFGVYMLLWLAPHSRKTEDRTGLTLAILVGTVFLVLGILMLVLYVGLLLTLTYPSWIF